MAHASLMQSAKRDETFLVVSIFVNPTQFGPNEDFEAYPRNEERDLDLCRNAGVDLVFLPPVEEMYPPGATTTIRVAGLSATLCGAHRPGHFDGVATVVAKLFNIVQPDVAYFGCKDAQQLAIIRRMVRDLDLPLEIRGCPTIREADGLAVSSRNAYLDETMRIQAACLYHALCRAKTLIESGVTDPTMVIPELRRIIDEAGPAKIDYIEIVNPTDLHPVRLIDQTVLVALAVRIGTTRLIDNIQVDPRRNSR